MDNFLDNPFAEQKPKAPGLSVPLLEQTSVENLTRAVPYFITLCIG